MLNRFFIAVSVLSVLAACSSVQEHPEEESDALVVKQKQALATVKPELKTAISSEVLYLLLTAEIAGQRSQFNVALDGYLEAAKRVDDARIAERAAKIGLYLRDNYRTEQAVDLWLEQDSSNLMALKIAVLTAFRAHQTDESVHYLQEILQQDPAGFEETLIDLVKATEKDDNAAFIYNVLESLSNKQPDQTSVLFVQAILAGQMRQDDLALSKINQVLSLQPEWNKALIFKAQLAVQNEQMDKAEAALLKVLEEEPENVKVARMLAQVYMRSEQYEKAIEQYESILSKTPDDGESIFAIALNYLQLENEHRAQEYLKRLINNPAWDAQASFYMGRIELKNDNNDEALVWFDKVTSGPYEFDSAMAAVTVLLSDKKYAECDMRLNRLQERFADKSVEIALMRSDVLMAQKQYQPAFDVLTAVLLNAPEHRDLLYSRALVAEKLGRLDLLEQDLLAILQKSPQDASALNALGYTLADQTDRLEDAERYLLEAIAINPDEPVIIDSLGWLRFKQGKRDEAIRLLRKAYDQLQEGEIAAHLAEVLWLQGEKKEAKSIIKRALKEKPDDEYLLKFKKRFLH